jgi:RND family efflux transporter MFP subunit
VGDAVRRGHLIAEIDPKDYRLQLQEAEAALNQTQAQSRNAKAQYERSRELYVNQSISKGDLDAARAASESADAAEKLAEKRVELAHVQVGYTRLTAPVAGSIAGVNVEVNENVSAGQPIVKLTSGAQPEVKVTIPDAIISQIHAGSEATVTFGAIPDKVFDATITEVGVASTGLITTFPVTVRLNEAADEVKPGMAGEVSFRFEAADARERILVPSVSVGEDRQGRYVFIVEPTEEGFGIAHRKEVTVGEISPEGLEILDGVGEGDLIVTAGITRIVDGQKVKLF